MNVLVPYLQVEETRKLDYSHRSKSAESLFIKRLVGDYIRESPVKLVTLKVTAKPRLPTSVYCKIKM